MFVLWCSLSTANSTARCTFRTSPSWRTFGLIGRIISSRLLRWEMRARAYWREMGYVDHREGKKGRKENSWRLGRGPSNCAPWALGTGIASCLYACVVLRLSRAFCSSMRLVHLLRRPRFLSLYNYHSPLVEKSRNREK